MRFRLLTSALLAVFLASGLAAPAHGVTTYQTANMVAFPGEPIAQGGGATLFRTKQAVHANLATSGLDKNAAYSVWWVVWNNPAECNDGCGADDLGSPSNSVFYATGFVTGEDGTANVSAHLKTGTLPLGIDVLIPGGLREGKGFDAEIHLVVRTHGAISPGNVDIQIGSFSGYCDVNVCADQQAVAFPPVP